MIEPGLALHAPDGNHATLTGSFLTALVLFEIVSGHSADALPYIEDIRVDTATQALLGQMASQAIADHPPCSRLE